MPLALDYFLVPSCEPRWRALLIKFVRNVSFSFSPYLSRCCLVACCLIVSYWASAEQGVLETVVMVLGCLRSTLDGDCMRGKAEQLVTTTGDCLSLLCQSPASWSRTSDITSEMRVDVGSLLSPWLFTRTRLSSASLGTAPSPSASPCRPCLGSPSSPCDAAVLRQPLSQAPAMRETASPPVNVEPKLLPI